MLLKENVTSLRKMGVNFKIYETKNFAKYEKRKSCKAKTKARPLSNIEKLNSSEERQK